MENTTENTNCISNIILFNTPDIHGYIHKKEDLNEDLLKNMKMCGEILDYEIDDKGIKIIKKFNLTSVDICSTKNITYYDCETEI